MMAQIPQNDDKYAAALDLKTVQGEKGYSTLERTAIRPTFDVCGIWGGYTGEGSKTVLPSKAYAKLSCRLVPHQNHEKIALLMKEYLEKQAPESIRIHVESLHGGEAYVCPIDLPAYKAAEKAYEKAFKIKPLAVRRGGSIPIIAVFERILQTKTILMGFGLESNAIHSPNENFPIDLWLKGIETVCGFYDEYCPKK
jgi:acetylornithine deacetylase/succinyl-diaminopimelate desuccinylase-like protein